MAIQLSAIRPIVVESEKLLLLDQRHIPDKVAYFDATTLDDMCFAIKDMVVRGAPAIGVAAACGLAFEAKRIAQKTNSVAEFMKQLESAKQRLQATRPTAVNLNWATEKIYAYAKSVTAKTPEKIEEIADNLIAEAANMIKEDIAINIAIGEHGNNIVPDIANILTHCNAGALATCGWGTALGVIRTAVQKGKSITVYADETRPRQQGARLTTWELVQDKIATVLITDSMAGYMMSQKKIDLVIVGADRIARNGDTANKIGTYSLAILAAAHNIPFYIAAPLSTIDVSIESGNQIPIEERSADEVTIYGGKSLTTPAVKVMNPSFDVTPAKFITAIITERGVLSPPYSESIQQLFAKSS